MGEAPRAYVVSFRVPKFAQNFQVAVEAADKGMVAKFEANQYADLTLDIVEGLSMKITFDIPVMLHKAPYGSQRAGDNFAALTYGSIVLARDERDGVSPLTPVLLDEIKKFSVNHSPYGGFLSAVVQMGEETLILNDYMSVGNAWDGGSFATWLPTK